MLIELHRRNSGAASNRVSIEARIIDQVHEGLGGETVVTTQYGKLPVEEPYEKVVKMREGAVR